MEKKNEYEEIKHNDYISFANDDEAGPLRSTHNKDMIFEIFEKPLVDSLEQMHKNRWIVESSLYLSKIILNYVCAYDYSKNNETIAKEVVNKLSRSESLMIKALFKLGGSVAKKIIIMSLPNKKFLDDL